MSLPGAGREDVADLSDADKLSLTTADRKFTIRTVACFGQCALAPVVEVNHRILSHVNERTLQRELKTMLCITEESDAAHSGHWCI